MKKMEEAAKQLGADLKLTDDTKHAKDIDLQSVATMKDACTKAHDEVPEKGESPSCRPAADDGDELPEGHGDVCPGPRCSGGGAKPITGVVRARHFKKVIDDEHNGHKAYRVKK